MSKYKLQKLTDYSYIIPRQDGMLVDGLIYTNEKMLPDILRDECTTQVANVAHLPGIIKNSLAMPDIHWGYGFPIGGVAAFDMNDGVISPGGVGYDINCGVRILRTNLERNKIKNKIRALVESLFIAIPTGVGSSRKDFKVNRIEEKKVLNKGARWAVENGFGDASDLDNIEDGGEIKGADANLISNRALERGNDQLGTLGSGNHFMEIGYVDEVYDEQAADVMGLAKDFITITIHTGSRGLGYQVCDDSIRVMNEAVRKYGFKLPDRQLCCAPLKSDEGKRYLSAMTAAANYAFCNRQLITHWTRQVFMKVLSASPNDLGLELVYDVAHNIAKIEKHVVDGKEKTVCVHRKGATRALGPGHPDIPPRYKQIGQPVLIPGDMGRYSYVLVGTEKAADLTFSSTCHGAGRVLSRHAAIRQAKGKDIREDLEKKNIIVRAKGRNTLAEEMPDAYKNVTDVVDVVHNVGISKKVARLKPLGVVKG